MIPLLNQIRKNVGRQAKEVSADSGLLFCTEFENASSTTYSRLCGNRPTEAEECRSLRSADARTLEQSRTPESISAAETNRRTGIWAYQIRSWLSTISASGDAE